MPAGRRALAPAAVVVLGALGWMGCAPALEDLKPALAAEDTGTVWFATAGSLVRAPDGSRFVASGEPVVLSGDLRLPAGRGPFPAVVLAHGCGGVGNAERGWAPVLRDWGYATFVVDSFGGRRLIEVCTDAPRLVSLQRVPDAYGALRVLSTHPRIAADRVALMGFSHGGILALAAATTWARDTFAPGGRPAFRAFLPFYPYCNTRYPERERVSAPVRMHVGELDDWTPAAPCVELAERLRATGHDVTVTVYPGAHHSFDNIGRSYQRLPNVDSAAGCVFDLPSILGPLPAAEIARCLRKGASIGWSPEAVEAARRNVRRELAALLGGR